MKDPCDAILEQMTALTQRREEIDKKIEKLEVAFNALSDPDVAAIVGEAYGVSAIDLDDDPAEERPYTGMQRVRDYVSEIPVGQTFTVGILYDRSVKHRNDAHTRHPNFISQRKASIALALQSMARGREIELVKSARGKDDAVYRRPEGRAA